MADITQKLGFDANSAITSLRNLSNALNQANANLRNLANLGREFTNKTQGMAAALSSMSKNAGTLVKALGTISSAAKSAQTSLTLMANTSSAKMAVAVNQYTALINKANQAAAAAANANKQANNLPTPPPVPPTPPTPPGTPKDKIDPLTGPQLLAYNMLTQGLRMFSQATRRAVEDARVFGLAITEIQTISADTGMSAEEMSSQILALSSELGKPAVDVAEGMYQVLSNQVVEAGDALGFLAQAQKLAITTSSDTADAVDALSSVMNSYNLSAADAAGVSDVLFETVYRGRLRLEDIADRIGRITPMAAQMGVRFEEVGAAIAVMTVQGVKADTAITQLRAILSKLMKPTEELQKVFQAWGVQDGEAAIRSFGGIAGVLQKLSKETGGSSAEMAEFFNVVRAMTGVMGLGTEEGKRFAEAIEQMNNASKDTRVADAWAIFQAAPAQKLTVAINEAKNAMIAFGTVLGPLATTGLSAVNHWLTLMADGLERIKGWASNTSFAESVSKRIEQQRVEAVKNAHQEINRLDYEGFRQREAAYRQHMAKLTASTAGAVAGIVAQQEGTNAALQSAGASLLQQFERSYKNLSDTVNNSAQKMEQGLETVKKLKETAANIRLELSLEKAKTATAKLAILQGDYNKKLQEAKASAATEGADPAKQAATTQSFEAAMAALEQVEEHYRSIGKVKQAQAAKERRAQIVDEMAAVERARVKENQAIQSTATSALASLDSRKARAEKLLQRMGELAKESSLGELTPSQAEELDLKMRSLVEELFKTFDGLGAQQGILDLMGIDTDIGKFTKVWQDGVKNMLIDWSVQTDSLKAELEKIQAKIQVELEVSPELLQNIKGTDLERRQGESVPAQQDRLLKALTDAEKSRVEATDELAKNTPNREALAKEFSNQLVNVINPAMTKLAERLVGLREIRDRNIRAGTKMAPAPAADLARTTESETVIDEYNKFLGQMQTQLASGTPLDAAMEKTLVTLQANLIQWTKLGVISDSVAQALKAQIDSTVKLNQETATAVSLTETKLEAEKTLRQLQPFKEVIDKQTPAKSTTVGEAKQEAGEVQRAVGSLNELTSVTANSMGTIVQKTGEVATGVGRTNTAQGGFLATVGSTLSRLNAELSVQAALTAEVYRTNAAKASVPATETAFSGGMMGYLAAGGRGQDNIPAMLSKGEYVSSAKTTGKFFSELNAMNNGSRPVYREQGGSVTNVGDVNVSVNGGDSSQATVREIGQALRREIQRGNIKLK